MEFKYGELFCGPGGLALGAKNAKVQIHGEKHTIKHAWAYDNDPSAVKTYQHNICPQDKTSVQVADVKELDYSDLDPIDILAFGFPCNDYSIVGKKRGLNGSYGPLYKCGVQAINELKPEMFIAENVGGMASANSNQAFKIILNELRHAGEGYHLTAHKYKFEEYGVPQTRHRIIIVGMNKTLDKLFFVPEPTHNPDQFITSSEALTKPPIPQDAANQEPTKQSKNVVERLSRIKPGKNAWQSESSMPEEYRLKVKNARISTIYKRLDPDKPAYTVTGSGGGGTHIYHWADNRALTNRERARLQTFPDKFEFIGNSTDVRKQIGMAVPVLAAKIIFTAALKTYCSIPYENTEANILLNEDGTITRS